MELLRFTFALHGFKSRWSSDSVPVVRYVGGGQDVVDISPLGRSDRGEGNGNSEFTAKFHSQKATHTTRTHELTRGSHVLPRLPWLPRLTRLSCNNLTRRS